MEKLCLKQIINESKKIVFMTGAGVSTASGIPDFRSPDGLYNQKYKLPPEEILSKSYFIAHPKEFFEFYRDKMIYPNAQPNDAHKAMKKLEELGKEVTVVTQNIDALHEMAGQKKVLNLHGSIYSNHCVKCNKYYSLEQIMEMPLVPKCTCGGIVKPDVVLYEEGLDMNIIYKAVESIEKCDTLIVCGTSLVVNPAASLVTYFKGKYFVIINLGETPYDRYANLIIRKPVEEVLQFILNE